MDQNSPFTKDIEAVSRITVVPAILQVICRTTGMGFAAVARVTPEHWVTLQVLDNVKFGLMPGSELKVDTTICHEIRQSGKPVIIDHVSEDVVYCNHHTPAMYGLQSYISMPIVRGTSGFFGTLCAIDATPALVSTPEMKNMFKAYADLIAFHLDIEQTLPADVVKQFADRSTYILNQTLQSLAGHDLHPPAVVPDAPNKLPPSRQSNQYAAIITTSAQQIRSLLEELSEAHSSVA